MTPADLRVVVADDERPARRFLIDQLEQCPGVRLVGEAETGSEAIAIIEQQHPDLALLDLRMPELGGLDVARRLAPADLPVIAFVTAFDDFAIDAFEINAIDYLLKPVDAARLSHTLSRARVRAERQEAPDDRAANLAEAAAVYEHHGYLERIPVRQRAEVILVPVQQVASIVAERELLHITTMAKKRHTITHRLHLLERQLDPRRFVRLGRGTLANVDAIAKLSPLPGGTYLATLSNGQQLSVSRSQSRALRNWLLKL